MGVWKRLFGRRSRLSAAPGAASSAGLAIDSTADLKRYGLPPGVYQVEQLERVAAALGYKAKKLSLSQLVDEWQVGRPERVDWSFQDAVDLGYKSSAWVFACCFRLARTLAQVPARMETRSKSDDWEPMKNGGSHPLAKLWAQPNPTESGVAVRERLVLHLLLGGNAILAKNRPSDDKPPGELWPWAPDKVFPVAGKDQPIDAYSIQLNGRELDRLPPEEVIHHQLPDPTNPRWGMAPMQAGARPADTDTQSSEWQVRSFQNSARPSLVISHDRELSPKQHEEGKKRLREDILGPENAGIPIFLGNAAKVAQLSLSPKEMDFLETRRMSREEICAVFGCPPPMIGIYDDATYSNFENARLVWWVDTLIPFLLAWYETLNQQLTGDFGDREEIRLWYDLRNVEALRPIMRQQEERAERLWKMGVPLERLNTHLNLGLDLTDVPSAKVSYLPSTMMPADELGNDTGAEGRQPAEKPEKPQPQLEVVRGRAGSRASS